MAGSAEVEAVEVELARGLRCLDRAAQLAFYLEEHPPAHSGERERLRTVTRRVRAARDAVEAAGVKLPPLRPIEDRGDGLPPGPGDEPESLTIAELARLSGFHRNTIIRWIRLAGGPIAERFEKARKGGPPARYTPQEVAAIIAAGA